MLVQPGRTCTSTFVEWHHLRANHHNQVGAHLTLATFCSRNGSSFPHKKMTTRRKKSENFTDILFASCREFWKCWRLRRKKKKGTCLLQSNSPDKVFVELINGLSWLIVEAVKCSIAARVVCWAGVCYRQECWVFTKLNSKDSKEVHKSWLPFSSSQMLKVNFPIVRLSFTSHHSLPTSHLKKVPMWPVAIKSSVRQPQIDNCTSWCSLMHGLISL